MLMPNRLISILGTSCLVAVVAYLFLLTAAVFFAASHSQVSAVAREAELRVAALETEYYSAISELNRTDAGVYGLTLPSEVSYVAEDGTPTFTRADR